MQRWCKGDAKRAVKETKRLSTGKTGTPKKQTAQETEKQTEKQRSKQRNKPIQKQIGQYGTEAEIRMRYR